MNYKELPKLTDNRPQIYARVDDDGVIRLTCTADHPPLQEWIAEGNTPAPAESE
tara:strand:+ start:1091 stop:1252 length:162 start_codon:yes stop_codon:yes gene_type:complete